MNYKNVQEIRLYPLDRYMYPTEEYAKVCIENGFDSYSTVSNLYCLNGGQMNLWWRTLFLFQYEGKIIAKGNVHIEEKSWGNCYYLDDILVFDEDITTADIKKIWGEFKKFNSTTQRIPLELLPNVLKLFDEKKQTENRKLGDKESFFLNRSEGNRVEYYVTKYERIPKYREQALRIHGITCQICGFNFEEFYGRLGEGFIEVHHKKPLYSLKKEVVPNPQTDMICVCSNCHKMLHRYRDSIITPEDLIAKLGEQKEKEKLLFSSL